MEEKEGEEKMKGEMRDRMIQYSQWTLPVTLAYVFPVPRVYLSAYSLALLVLSERRKEGRKRQKRNW
jgi:hypothetical protein